MEQIKKKWESLPPKKKQTYLAVGVGLILLPVLWNFLTPQDPSTLPQNQPRNLERIFTDTDPRSMTIEAMSSRIRNTESDISSIRTDVTKLMGDMRELRARDGVVTRNDLETMRQSVQRDIQRILQEELPGLMEARDQAANPRTVQPADPDNPFSGAVESPEFVPGAFDRPTQRPTGPAMTGEQQPASSGVKIRRIGEEPQEQAAVEEEGDGYENFYLPTGTILSGTLLNGLDAPTSADAKSDPHPVLIRIQHEAILPNNFTADISEAFVTASSYGELSSERAYIRAQTLSLVRNDGKVIEVDLRAYGVGEDGKVGLRGRLVNKEGQIVASALVANGLKAFSQIFSQAPVPTLATGQGGGQVQFQSLLSSASLQTAAVSGVAGVFDRMSEYYLSALDEIFPVIEIGADRTVELILTRGAQLRIIET